MGAGGSPVSTPRLIRLGLFVMLLLAGTAFLSHLVDRNLGVGWPSNVVRNWEQFGLFGLHGRMVQNVGGYQALDQPDVYAGMSPASLYPAFVLRSLFAWTGAGSLPFHLALNLAVFLSLWRLFRRTGWACLIAAVTVVCPGYIRWPMILDPNTLAVLIGLPFAALLFGVLKNPVKPPAAIAVFFLILAYTCLNWTTVLVHGLLLACCLAAQNLPRRNLLLYAVMSGFCGAVVLGASLYEKTRGGAGTGADSGQFFQMYAWGHVGYGAGMTTTKAIVRLGFVNLVGLFPLLGLWVWLWITRVDDGGRRNWIALLPLAVSGMEVMALRNYFGHHPWMAAPVVLVGMILSALVLVQPQPAAGGSPAGLREWNAPARGLYLVAAFCYGTIVLVVFHTQAETELSLIAMVRQHTQRSDALLVVPSLDPALAADAKRFAESLDRRIIVQEPVGGLLGPGVEATCLLSAHATNAWPVVAESEAPRLGSLPVLQRLLQWFNQTIARRNPGDRIEFAKTYYLCRPGAGKGQASK